MSQTDLPTNNSSEEPLVIDEMTSLKQYLEGHPQREEILRNVREYEVQIFKQERNKKLLGS
ncbi:MAG TPA: hypothetical protein V6D25_29670 [Leptolyngbyaceae cyanobacterium]